jgi:2'-5' RNA ligase
VRLFVAVNFPESVRRGLWEAVEPVRRRDTLIRWVEPNAIHLTLKFLGEVEPEREPAIQRGLAGAVAGARRFPLRIEGFGVFPNASRPRVVWAGCEAAPPLEVLQHRIEQEMEHLGFPVEGRPFRPHVTLGRARNGAPAAGLAAVGAAFERLEYSGDVTVSSVDLMESMSSPTGTRYVARYAAELT